MVLAKGKLADDPRDVDAVKPYVRPVRPSPPHAPSTRARPFALSPMTDLKRSPKVPR